MPYSTEIKALAAANDLRLLNREKLKQAQPSLIEYDRNPHGIKFYEHPIHGDGAPVIADLNGVFWSTGFYDPWNDTDQMYISEQAQQLGLIDSTIDVWK